MIKTIEDLRYELERAEAAHEVAEDRVRELEEERDTAKSDLLRASAELVNWYPELAEAQRHLQAVQRALYAANGEPS